MLNIHPKTIQRYIREGKLRATKIGKGWRITGHDLSTFTESNSYDTPARETNRSTVLSLRLLLIWL
jgi:excisionase family DNA binding protein